MSEELEKTVDLFFEKLDKSIHYSEIPKSQLRTVIAKHINEIYSNEIRRLQIYEDTMKMRGLGLTELEYDEEYTKIQRIITRELRTVLAISSSQI